MEIIHPASRGVATHTAGLFRSVRGLRNRSKTSCSTMLQLGLPKLSNFHFSPRRGFPGENFHFFPPWRLPKLGNFRFSPGASQATEFLLFPDFPPVGGSPKLRNFHFSSPCQLPKLGIFIFPHCDSFPSYGIFTFASLGGSAACFCNGFLQTLHFCRHKTGRKHHVRQCFQFSYLPNR